MGQDAIVIVKQESNAGSHQLLSFQYLHMGKIHQHIAAIIATFALFRAPNCTVVALLSSREENIFIAQVEPTAVPALGILVPGTLAWSRSR